MNEGRLVVEELDGCVRPSGACLETILNFLQLSRVSFLELGNTQAILLWNFRLEDDLHLL